MSSFFRKVLQALDSRGKTQTSETGQGGVAKGRQELRDRSSAHTAVVFSESDVADTVEAIFDSPMGSGKLEEILGSGLISHQTGHKKHRFR